MAGWIAKREGQPKPFLARFRQPGGKTVSKAFALKREARDWLAEQQTTDVHIDPDAGKGTLGAYADEWATRIDVRDSTRSNYRSFIRNQLAPLRGHQLREITEADIEEWIVALKPRHAARTVRGAVSLLRRILEDAVTRRELVRSPLASVKRFEAVTPKAPKPKNPNTRFLTRDEIGRLADAIDPAYRAMVMVGAYAGLRWGEAAALSPADLNIEKRELAVRSNLVQPDDGRPPFRSMAMKTDSSARTIALGDLAAILQEHAAHYAHHDWMFPDSQGGPLRASNWRRRVWLPATEAARLAPPVLRYHDLRHTHASLLIAQGESVLVVQKRLGHARPSITLDIYGSLFPGADEAAADRLTTGLIR